MKYMKEETFKVVKKSEAYRVIGKGLISTKWVDTDKSHGNSDMLARSSRWVTRDLKLKRRKRPRGFVQCDPTVGTHQMCDFTPSDDSR